MKKQLIMAVTASAAFLALTHVSVAATGEVTLSGSTWTGKVDGSTKYTGSSLGSAVQACNNAMSSGTINIRNSGSTTTHLAVGSNRTIDGRGTTITANFNTGNANGLVRSFNTSSIKVQNFTMARGSSYPWFGLYFKTVNGQTATGVHGTGGGISFRADNCGGGPGYNFGMGSPNVSGNPGHGIETMGVSGSGFSSITSNDHSEGCGLLLQSNGGSGSQTGTTVSSTRANYSGGYAGFRTANNNRNTSITYDNATSCGRGFFSTSGSSGCTLTRVNSNYARDIGIWIQSSSNTKVSGGTIVGTKCWSITDSTGCSVTVTCR